MGLYYFYHNSPLNRANMISSYRVLGQKPLVPTRVGGTRWVSHFLRALDYFLRGYKGFVQHLEQVEEQVDVKHSDDEDFGPSVFSWRKQVTKWDWYEAVRRRELGRVDSHSEEQTSVSSSALQMSAVYVDCQSLAQSLQELPLHLRLNWSSFPLHQFCNPS
ncbi:uncharacterized protein LOC121329964 isoform X1 [Polyodon spathula]|uniref:uncharacterized protein LOC121329964 isoform X1 n=1 Tax=Polyodon spathula TaxID=7913 RepID=UPI001B7E10F5|nr:uncharacterized protein LOC121329964 isoform X1 [Polyodon spathula]